VAKQRELEERYLSDDSLGKYDRSIGGEPSQSSDDQDAPASTKERAVA
jgi:hypothetical protein